LIYASAVLVDGKIYYQSQEEGVYVVAAKPDYELLAHNKTQDTNRSNACPVPDAGRLLIRSDGYLYCLQ
jgi:hypothetical protein